MRSMALVLPALLALALPLAAQAGEGCDYSEAKVTTASFDAPAEEVATHHGSCSGSCSHASEKAESASGACPCSAETTADGEDASASDATVAATDR